MWVRITAAAILGSRGGHGYLFQAHRQTPDPAHVELEVHRQLPKLETPLADTEGLD